MAVTNVRIFNNYNEYMGLSTDAKPVGATPNSLFLELDTGNLYYLSDEEEKLLVDYSVQCFTDITGGEGLLYAPEIDSENSNVAKDFLGFVVGETYIVDWDGTRYVCVAKQFDDDNGGGEE